MGSEKWAYVAVSRRGRSWSVLVYDPAVKRKVWVGSYLSLEAAERAEDLAKPEGARARPGRSEGHMNALAMLEATPPGPGFTYFISAKPYDGWVKIGRSRSEPSAGRLQALQCGNPRPLTVRACWSVDVEWHLHLLYEGFRGSGEWFELPAPLVEYAGSCASEERPWIALARAWPADRVAGTLGSESRVP